MTAKRRKAARRRREKTWLRLTLRVAAASVSVDRFGPGIMTGEPDGRSSSSITVEGALDRPAFKELTRTVLLILQRDDAEGNPGAAIGGTIVWNVVARLPRAQFADLLAVVLAGKLDRVEMGFEEIKRGSGIMRSVSFYTAPVPSEAEDEEEDPPSG